MTSLKNLSNLNQALDQSSIVSITDGEGTIIYVNDQFCRVSQYSGSELLGKNHSIIKSEYHSEGFYQQLWKTISQGKVWRGEIKNKTKDGSFYWVDTVITPISDTAGKPFQYISISNDITKYKLYEEKLIAEKESAEADSRAKSVFLANTSHEIRNPMNGIIGMSSILARTQLTAEQCKYLSLIQLSSEKLMSIINDILDFSKMEAGKLQIHNKTFILKEFIEETIILNQTYAQQKGLELIYKLNACDAKNFIGDPDRLRQVLINLLQNGIKFTDKGFVKLEVESQKLTEDRCLVSFAVTDTGIGIKQEDISRLFQPFYQLDSSLSKKHEGTGLGLAIVKKLVDMMGGKIAVESTLGMGSKFTVEVAMEIAKVAYKPLPASEPGTLEEEAPKNLSGAKVLIAEDNAVNRMHLSLLLGGKGYKIFEATNGQEALMLYEQEQFDVILMDGQMPKMDGFLAIKKIREIEKNTLRHTPIIALSGYANDSDKNKFYHAGVDEFVSKPVSEYELFDKIKALIG
jgi:PAS domain S-box-containing protein